MSLPNVVPQASSACFDDLPNELIDIIVSLSNLPGIALPVSFIDENGVCRAMSEALRLMHVSTKFRRAVFRAKFWHDYYFQFDHLFGFRTFCDSDPAIRRNFIYKHFFANADLIQNLQGKTDWIFQGPEDLVQTLSSLPNFFATVRRVRLYWATDLAFALRHLRHCHQLEQVQTGYSIEYLDLSLFQWLKLKRLDLTCPVMYVGNLHELAGLETFTVDVEKVGDGIPHNVLPLGSANTLTFLDLDCGVDETFSLEAFTNLDTLRYFIPPEDDVQASFFEVLAPCTSRLRSLHTRFILRECEEVSAWAEYQRSIFILPSLQYLKELNLDITARSDHSEDFDGSDTYVELCMDILDTLAGNLLSLETLIIFAGLDVPRLEPLGNLKVLKRLDWIVYNADSLRGVPIGADLTLCIPKWFHEFVENAYVYIQTPFDLAMKGKTVLAIFNEKKRFFLGKEAIH
jgi:hypothetical protein